jgi:hemoglobin
MTLNKPDIETREDIDKLVHRFYEHLLQESKLAHFFTDFIEISWDTHFPRIVDFWEQVIFNTGSYSGNPMQIHKHVHQMSPITPAHLDEWVKWFQGTVDEMYAGNNAELAKQRAYSIAQVMAWKIVHAHE